MTLGQCAHLAQCYIASTILGWGVKLTFFYLPLFSLKFWYSCTRSISSGLSLRAIVGSRCLGCSSGRESTRSAVALSSNLAFRMVAIKYGMYSNDFSALTGSGCHRSVLFFPVLFFPDQFAIFCSGLRPEGVHVVI